jgi:hypothetical protein
MSDGTRTTRARRLRNWQHVRRHAEVMAAGAEQHDVINPAVRTRQAEAFNDLGRAVQSGRDTKASIARSCPLLVLPWKGQTSRESAVWRWSR